MNILVTGGTGSLGRTVVKRLLEPGHRVRILSRRPGTGDDWIQGDLATGAGLEAAVAGIDAIVHAASATRQPQEVRATDVLGTRRLLAMAREAGVRHAVYVSIAGIDGVAFPYYKAKLAAEAVMRENIVPWSILRSTQFHPFMEVVLGAFSMLPRVAILPFKWRFQPVDAGEVAARLVDVVAAPPAGMLPDFGGPEVRDFKSIAESWLKARKLNKRLVNLTLPLKASRMVADGRLTCPDHKDGAITFEQYLDGRYTKQP
jgi:uncharacterized protein YbjT (DUF2867 family)